MKLELTLTENILEFRFGNSPVGFSARRLWEHTEHGQLNPFKPLTPLHANSPGYFIDVVLFVRSEPSLTSYVLSDLLEDGCVNAKAWFVPILKSQINSPSGKVWLRAIQAHLIEHTRQVYVRNRPESFLKTDKESPLGIPRLKCALLTWIDQELETKASSEQWLSRIKKLEQRGLRRDEYVHSFLEKNLQSIPNRAIDGSEVKKLLDYSRLQISILPAQEKSRRHLNFRIVKNADPIKRIKPKFKTGNPTEPKLYDAVLGYWIDRVTWNDLFGIQEAWAAFTHRGQLITHKYDKSGLCENAGRAMFLANQHARQLYPKLSTAGHWSEHSLTGGENYREWLVTLPYFRASYFSDHYDLRNILLHIRSDLRKSSKGEQVLFIQEIQSDWCQEARQAGKSELYSPSPPWLKEWPELALKLLLLRASRSGIAALAWTTGDIQVNRWNGLGKEGLLQLYDRQLPSLLNGILKKYKKSCESIDVFIPANYSIDPIEDGYEVRDKDGNLLGAAETWEQARVLIPCRGQEYLIAAHGVTLDHELKSRILEDGFFAWGYGIK